MPGVIAKKTALLACVLGSFLGLCGCNTQGLISALGPLLQGGVPKGIPGLGGAPGAPTSLPPATGQLNGPLTAGFQPGDTTGQNAPLPQAPTNSGANGLGAGAGGAGGDTASAAAGSLGDRIKQAAEDLPIPFPYAPGTEGGNLGCADVVTTALINAGALDQSEHALTVDGAVSNLRGRSWQSVTPPPYKDGDVIVWSPTRSGHKHIGIIAVENGQVYAINNSSSQRRPVKILLSDYDRGVDDVLRSPEMMS